MTDSKYCFHFRPLEAETIEVEIATIRAVEKELEEEWRIESLKYEETMTVPHCPHPVARRNYFNPQGIVQDVSLFPYHDFYYPLMDAYDCLYTLQTDHPILPAALRPQMDRSTKKRSLFYRIQNPDEFGIENHFPYIRSCFFTSPVLRASNIADVPYQGDELYTSPDSVVNCILWESDTDMRPASKWVPARTSPRLGDGQHEFWSEMRQMFLEGETLDDTNISLPTSSKLPREVKIDVLFRLLRHALSECQRDYYLALSILTRLSHDRALDDVSMLRKVLLVINNEFVECDNLCVDFMDRNHDCGEWSAFLNGLHLAIGLGITVMTEEHAVTLASFVRSSYLHEFGHRLLMESEPLEKQRRTRLKRVIAALRTEDGPSSLHIQLVEIILRALGTRAHLERKRCREAINRTSISDDILGTFLSSYWNCIRALVDIGDATVEIIPDSEPYFILASEAVKNTAYGFMELVSPPANRVDDTEYHEEGSTYLMPAHTDVYPNVIQPTRYLDILLQRRERFDFTSHPARIDSNSVSAILDLERPNKVLNTVRSLFVRDMVDIRLSRMGYGDFVVWCGFPLNMDDPIMLWHEYQCPVEAGDEEDTEESDDSDEDETWVHDETESGLSPSQLRSRYDFSVLVALRAWQAPWTPLIHHTFSPSFSRSMKELLLCTHQLRIPNEVVLRILPFLDRRWWPDSQPECWSYTCQSDSISKNVHSRKQGEVSIPNGVRKPLLTCSSCRTAAYCSKKCMKDDMKAGHRRSCCLPPFKRCAEEEKVLFKSVFKEDIPDVLLYDSDTGQGVASSDALMVENSDADVSDEMVEDDDGSWESWDSDEDNESPTVSLNLTETISNYFSKS